MFTYLEGRYYGLENRSLRVSSAVQDSLVFLSLSFLICDMDIVTLDFLLHSAVMGKKGDNVSI